MINPPDKNNSVDLQSAARALALRSLEYVGWLDGLYDRRRRMECDDEIVAGALAVFAALGEEPPAKGSRRRRK